VRLGAPALARLIRALWQSNPPYILRIAASQISSRIPPAAFAALRESVSVVDPRAHGQEKASFVDNSGGRIERAPIFCSFDYLLHALSYLRPETTPSTVITQT